MRVPRAELQTADLTGLPQGKSHAEGLTPYQCPGRMLAAMTDMTIGRAARAAGVGIETIRFYERKGLIARPLKPRDGVYRLYPPETIARIRFIRAAQGLGFSLAEIGELLSLSADPRTQCGTVRKRAEAKLADVDARIARLEAMRSALEALIAACPGGGKALRHCSILAAFDG